MVQITRPWINTGPAAVNYSLSLKIQIARIKLHRNAKNIFYKLWWKYIPGTIIEVKWPVGSVLIHEIMDGTKTYVESADPNDHYRSALEKYVGKQGRDWNWKIGKIKRLESNQGGDDTILIKMRKGRDDYAPIAKLKWS